MDINSTLPDVLLPLVDTVNYFVNIVQVLVGGLFGLYVILIILRWREARQTKKLMKDIRDEVQNLRQTIESIYKPMPRRRRKR